MCDSIVATPDSTKQQIMLFGKNSDRQRNEAQSVDVFSAADYLADTELRCTYVIIPQLRHTHAVMLCRPFWSWGAEMGANEHGLVIGNEAVHARSSATTTEGLPGMDLVRLALERAVTAAEAVGVITDLLERYGQGGDCGHLTSAYYNNSFLIADQSEAFVLETVDREWLVEHVSSIRSISNVYSIRRNAVRESGGLSALVRTSGWSTGAVASYADVIADPQREHIGHARARAARSTSLLNASLGHLTLKDMATILRDHGSQNHPETWQPDISKDITLCMHAGSEDRAGQTTGSMISELHGSDAVHWVTATAAPCISIFKPVFIGTELSSSEPRPTDNFDSATLWWRHERMHRWALRTDFAGFLNDVRNERDALEAQFRESVAAVMNGGNSQDRSRIAADCWHKAILAEDRWSARIHRSIRSDRTAYSDAWSEMNRIASLHIPPLKD